MRNVLRLGLLIAVALVARAQDGNATAAFSSHAVYQPLPRQARIQGEVTVLLSQEANFKAVPSGHPLLLAGVQPDAAQWKQWAAIGMERVVYVFRIDPDSPIVITTRVQVPRRKLARLIPWVKKTRMEEHTEYKPKYPATGGREVQVSGKTLTVTITGDNIILQTLAQDRAYRDTNCFAGGGPFTSVPTGAT